MRKPVTLPKSKSSKKIAATKPHNNKPVRRSATGAPARNPPQGKSGSKQASVIAMLQSSKGATIQSMMTATGWQQHSVRGFLAGVAKKKLKLNVISEQSEHGRIYRVEARKNQKPVDRAANL